MKTPGVSIEELFSLSLSVNSGATAVPVMIGRFVDSDGADMSVVAGMGLSLGQGRTVADIRDDNKR
jgi:hypothetical protein